MHGRGLLSRKTDSERYRSSKEAKDLASVLIEALNISGLGKTADDNLFKQLATKPSTKGHEAAWQGRMEKPGRRRLQPNVRQDGSALDIGYS